MKVGDIITAYHAGFHRIDRIEKRYITDELQAKHYKGKKVGDERSSLYYYTRIADGSCNPKKGQERNCDESYCKLATTSIEEEVKALEERIDKLKQFKQQIK